MAIEFRSDDSRAQYLSQLATGQALGARQLAGDQLRWAQLGQQGDQFTQMYEQRERLAEQSILAQAAQQQRQIEASQSLQQAGFANELDRMQIDYNRNLIMESVRLSPDEQTTYRNLTSARDLYRRQMEDGTVNPRVGSAVMQNIEARLGGLRNRMQIEGVLTAADRRQQREQQFRNSIVSVDLPNGTTAIGLFDPETGQARSMQIDTSANDTAVRRARERQEAVRRVYNDVASSLTYRDPATGRMHIPLSTEIEAAAQQRLQALRLGGALPEEQGDDAAPTSAGATLAGMVTAGAAGSVGSAPSPGRRPSPAPRTQAPTTPAQTQAAAQGQSGMAAAGSRISQERQLVEETQRRLQSGMAAASLSPTTIAGRVEQLRNHIEAGEIPESQIPAVEQWMQAAALHAGEPSRHPAPGPPPDVITEEDRRLAQTVMLGEESPRPFARMAEGGASMLNRALNPTSAGQANPAPRRRFRPNGANARFPFRLEEFVNSNWVHVGDIRERAAAERWARREFVGPRYHDAIELPSRPEFPSRSISQHPVNGRHMLEELVDGRWQLAGYSSTQETADRWVRGEVRSPHVYEYLETRD